MRSISDIPKRQAQILGLPPRIAPLAPEEVSEEERAIISGVLAAISRNRPEKPAAHTAIMLRHPELYRRQIALGLQLFQGELSPRHRELAILRVGWLCQAPFEWGEHVDVGKRIVGLTDEDIERVKQGAAAHGWTEDDRAIVRAVEELVDDAMISEDTWAVLARYLDDKQLIELPILVGQYQGVAYLQNSLRCPLLPGNPGLTAR